MKKWILLLLLSSPALAKPNQLFNACTGCGDFTYAPDSTSIVGAFSGCSGTQYLGADGACHAGGGSGSPSGPTYAVQYSSNSSFTGTPNFTFNNSSVTIAGPLGLGVSYGVAVGSLTVSSPGNLSFTNTSDPNSYQIVGSSTNPTVGHLAVFSSSWAIIDGGVVPTSGGGGGGGGVGGAFADWYMVDSGSGKWYVQDNITGHLVSTSTNTIPSGSLAVHALVTQDSGFNLWAITIDTGGHLVTALAGTTAQSITDLLMNDANSVTWVNTVSLSGHLVTQ